MKTGDEANFMIDEWKEARRQEAKKDKLSIEHGVADNVITILEKCRDKLYESQEKMLKALGEWELYYQQCLDSKQVGIKKNEEIAIWNAEHPRKEKQLPLLIIQDVEAVPKAVIRVLKWFGDIEE